MRQLAFALALLSILAGCASPVDTASVEDAAPVDLTPLLEVTNETFDFGVLLTTTRTVSAPAAVRVHGAMYRPVGDGPYPVLLFMHGNHGTCFLDPLGRVPGAGQCRDVGPMRVDPSFAGYSYLANDLASRGYVVLSIDANDVNDQNNVDDFGANQRAQLFLRILDDLAASDDPTLDMTRIGLMGHSRGGEGVARAIVMNAERPEPYSIGAAFALAPTDFSRHVVLGVPFGTILPYCDGDVWNLHGAWLYDDARYAKGAGPLHQFLVQGANHNWFNEVWDYDDARYAGSENNDACGENAPVRLSPESQREIGLAIMGGFFRHYLGGEPVPALFGDAPFEAAASVHTSYLPAADVRFLIEDALDDGALSKNDAGGATSLEGFSDATHCVTAVAGRGPPEAVFLTALLTGATAEGTCPTEPNTSTAPQLSLAFDGPATARFAFPAHDASALRYVSFRAGVDFDATKGPIDARIVLTDASRASASALASEHASALFVPVGGDEFAKIVLNEVRVPLSAFDGVDLAHLNELAIVFGEEGTGRVQLADIMLR